MSFAVVVLIARLALVLILYLFLMVVVRAMYRDLRTVSAPAPRVRAGAAPKLVVLAAGQTAYQVGQEFRLHGPTMLGRDPASDIPVEDDFVSGQHLRVLNGPIGWLAQDLQSRNGTRLNGTRLQGAVPLKQGDLLDVGRLRLRFTLEN